MTKNGKEILGLDPVTVVERHDYHRYRKPVMDLDRVGMPRLILVQWAFSVWRKGGMKSVDLLIDGSWAHNEAMMEACRVGRQQLVVEENVVEVLAPVPGEPGFNFR